MEQEFNIVRYTLLLFGPFLVFALMVTALILRVLSRKATIRKWLSYDGRWLPVSFWLAFILLFGSVFTVEIVNFRFWEDTYHHIGIRAPEFELYYWGHQGRLYGNSQGEYNASLQFCLTEVPKPPTQNEPIPIEQADNFEINRGIAETSAFEATMEKCWPPNPSKIKFAPTELPRPTSIYTSTPIPTNTPISVVTSTATSVVPSTTDDQSAEVVLLQQLLEEVKGLRSDVQALKKENEELRRLLEQQLPRMPNTGHP